MNARLNVARTYLVRVLDFGLGVEEGNVRGMGLAAIVSWPRIGSLVGVSEVAALVLVVPEGEMWLVEEARGWGWA